ncbi:hypothetical protein HNR60_004367 [Rhodopseudomonas rhenobacensis]|uniref:Uncharacterized protein n=1 Tax=Rhodopseudomonas rhenobacensis TaxID=87461 RepID=A0A7W7Z7S4_9BRAD|nr:hypothetical protein [Rhodopseudomonas rhenobacensis]MBB5049586.1 hypothetical protein [Rhodopseudomonas rhenobacensis]
MFSKFAQDDQLKPATPEPILPWILSAASSATSSLITTEMLRDIHEIDEIDA